MEMRPRPEPGKTTKREIKVEVCGTCGYVIDNLMCSYDCPHDTDLDRPKIIMAVYERTDVFLRDEVVDPAVVDMDGV